MATPPSPEQQRAKIAAAMAGDAAAIAALGHAMTITGCRRSGDPPAFFAARQRFWPLAVIQAIVGRDPSGQRHEGRTLLFPAASAGRSDVVRWLLACGVDPAVRDGHGYTAIMVGAWNPDVVRQLWDCPGDLSQVSPWGESVLRIAYRWGDLDGVRGLIARGADPGHLASGRVHAAVLERDLAALRRLPPSAWRERNRWDHDGFLAAVHAGWIEGAAACPLADRMRARGHCGIGPMQVAAAADRADMLAWLLEEGAGVDDRADDSSLATPLHAAAEHDCRAAIRRLLAAGADVHALDHVGATPLNRARSQAATALLVEAGADPAHVDGCGEWPLKDAAAVGDLDRLVWLVDHGVDVNQAHIGTTALHAASGCGQAAAVRWLLDQGADPGACDVDCDRPVDLAFCNEIRDCLERRG
ncbi:MAG: hypothetical protein RLZZ127_1331 [Planctomycetota bacterium]|jgi:ankyrin repeat protein